MKRRRHDIVELSSDDSLDDFVPTKLKSKRVSIVLNKDPVPLKPRKNGSSKSCKNSRQQSSSSKQTDQSKSDDGEKKISRTRGRPRKDDKPRITIKLPLSSPEVKVRLADPVDRTTKAKPDFSDLDDSLLIDTNKPDPTANQSRDNNGTSNSLQSIENLRSGKSTEQDQNDEDLIKLSSPIHSSTLLPDHTSPTLPPSTTPDSSKQENCSPHENTHLSRDSDGGEILDTNGSLNSRALEDNDNRTLPKHPDDQNSGIRERNNSHLIGTSKDIDRDPHLSPNSNQDSKDLRISPRHNTETLGYSFCQICKKNITGYSAERRRSHVNKLVICTRRAIKSFIF